MPEIAFDASPDHRWLFLFAHPDDELAMAAWIRRLRSAGVSVAAAWLHSTPIRERESRGVAQQLGLEDSDLRFMQFEDGKMLGSLDELHTTVRDLVENHAPTRIATMAFEQGHLDHDSVNLVANFSLPGRVVEYPMYHGYWRSFMPLNEFACGNFETMVLARDEQALKRELLRSYPSQTIRRNVVLYGLLRRLSLRPVEFDRREVARIQTHTEWLVPNHPLRNIPRILASENWRRWERSVKAFLNE